VSAQRYGPRVNPLRSSVILVLCALLALGSDVMAAAGPSAATPTKALVVRNSATEPGVNEATNGDAALPSRKSIGNGF
jgi:hypothetical protein